jgi:hypothetical protein
LLFLVGFRNLKNFIKIGTTRNNFNEKPATRNIDAQDLNVQVSDTRNDEKRFEVDLIIIQ